MKSNRKICEKVLRTWKDQNEASAKVSMAQAFLDAHGCDAETALCQMDVSHDDFFEPYVHADE
jgi:hypothetical protein